MRKFKLALGLGAAVAVLALSPLAVARTHSTTVTVAASEFKFKLSKSSAKAGKVTFKVTNKGRVAHDFKIAGKKTPLIKPGKSATLKVTLKKKGQFKYICTVAGHARAGMGGVFKAT
jgi:uncharacterized cupredoxin-like copper-binding protein